MPTLRWAIRVRGRLRKRMVLVDADGADVVRLSLGGWPRSVRHLKVTGPDGSRWDVAARYDELEVTRDGEVVASVSDDVLALGDHRMRWDVRMDGSRTGTIADRDGDAVLVRVAPGEPGDRLWAAIEIEASAPDHFLLALLASTAMVRADADTAQVDAPSSPTT